MGLKYAICSEIFQGWELPDICMKASELGYEGLEIAHFHMFDDVRDISADGREQMKSIIEEHGLECVGLHWLLAAPKGLHITTSDDALRKKSWAYFDHLIDFCGDLGGKVMILGSPHQRASGPTWSVEDAQKRLVEGLIDAAPHASERGVTLLMEAVPSDQGDVVTRLEHAAQVVEAVNHPNVQSMFDTHNTADETEPQATLLEKYYPITRHVHVNEMDGRYPGTGDYDFKALLEFLIEQKYGGWVSLEVFDFTAGSEKIARENIEYLKKLEAEIVGKE